MQAKKTNKLQSPRCARPAENKVSSNPIFDAILVAYTVVGVCIAMYAIFFG